MEALSKQSIRLLRLFGNTTARKVTPSVGAEQEYFLIDIDKFRLRKDLVYTGRTLFGSMPAKGQEMDDHYFGALRSRVAAFMHDVNEELWKMGVAAKTQHNEVAPSQHELACIYSQANVATDNNQLVMQTLKRVASRYDFKCLLHEKPFAGVNGSGKHNNWSLATDEGLNLLEPGTTPHQNVQFLLILSCIVKAIDEHAGLLRESACDPGNDLRLGVHEAPPAIISVYLGEQLGDVVRQLVSSGEATSSPKGGVLQMGVRSLPDLYKDATDRNRTSPFAFTGNKFEFRMVGSRDSIAEPNVVINAIVAEAFSAACDELEKAADFEAAVQELIIRNFREHQRIIFDGNGYSDAWVEEAARRGLPNLPSMVDAIPELITRKTVAMYKKLGILSRAELASRAEVKYEFYAKTINIEAKAMINIASKQIIPAVIRCAGDLAGCIAAIRSAGAGSDAVPRRLLEETTALLDETQKALDALVAADGKAASLEEGRRQARYCRDHVVPAMEALRAPVDRLEMIVGKDYWPMPSYGDLLFKA